MKHINKVKTGNGYKALLKIHKSNGCYDDTKNDKSKSITTRTDMLNELLKEQQNLCAYCMSRIDKSNASIEHIIGQSYIDEKGVAIGKQKDTDYDNMLAVCSGTFCQDNQHCDKSRAKYQHKEPLLYISPLNKPQMNYIKFSRNGKISCKINDKNIKNDLEKILNLNCTALVENRKKVKDAVYTSLIKKKFDKRYIDKQILYWNKCSEPYNQVALEELRKHV